MTQDPTSGREISQEMAPDVLVVRKFVTTVGRERRVSEFYRRRSVSEEHLGLGKIWVPATDLNWDVSTLGRTGCKSIVTVDFDRFTNSYHLTSVLLKIRET